MRAKQFVLVAASLSCFSTVYADCPPCGPTYCTNTAEYSRALAAKKKALLADYPQRLVEILDRVGHCEACITSGPDGFSLLRKTSDGGLHIDSWNAENEKIGAMELAAGTLKACRVIYVREAFACCKEKAPKDRSDWDKDLELNTDMSVPCSAQ